MVSTGGGATVGESFLYML